MDAQNTDAAIRDRFWTTISTKSISAFVIAYIVIATVYLSPPSPWRDIALQPLQPVIDYVGLRQDYCLFAPDPLKENVDLSAEVTLANGEKEIWTFPRMDKLGFLERIVKERYRKFGDEHLLEKTYLWPDFCRYLAATYAGKGKRCVSITLIKHWAEIPPPEEGMGRSLPVHNQQSRFFTYRGG